MTKRETLGDRARERRLELDLTLRALAAKSGLSVETVRKIEDGTSASPTLDTLRALAHGLGLTVGDLVEGE